MYSYLDVPYIDIHVHIIIVLMPYTNTRYTTVLVPTYLYYVCICTYFLHVGRYLLGVFFFSSYSRIIVYLHKYE